MTETTSAKVQIRILKKCMAKMRLKIVDRKSGSGEMSDGGEIGGDGAKEGTYTRRGDYPLRERK